MDFSVYAILDGQESFVIQTLTTVPWTHPTLDRVTILELMVVLMETPPTHVYVVADTVATTVQWILIFVTQPPA